MGQEANATDTSKSRGILGPCVSVESNWMACSRNSLIPFSSLWNKRSSSSQPKVPELDHQIGSFWTAVGRYSDQFNWTVAAFRYCPIDLKPSKSNPFGRTRTLEVSSWVPSI